MYRDLELCIPSPGPITCVTVLWKDEFGQLAVSFNRFSDRIHTPISEVSSTTHVLGEATRRVLSASNSSMEKSDYQSGYITSVAAAIEQLGANNVSCTFGNS